MPARMPLTPDDFWSLRFITDMRLSPDGSSIAYVLQTNDRAANKVRSAIWLLDTRTGASRPLTTGLARDTSPRWSPDGQSLAFISDREDETAQVYLLRLDGGEARRLTLTRRGAGDPFWSPDGAWIGFTSEERAGERPLLAAPLSKAEREKREGGGSRPPAPDHSPAISLGWPRLLRGARQALPRLAGGWPRRATHLWRLRRRACGLLARWPNHRLHQRPRARSRRQHDGGPLAARPGDARPAPPDRRDPCLRAAGLVARRDAARLCRDRRASATTPPTMSR